jgi:hypothetical protein
MTLGDGNALRKHYEYYQRKGITIHRRTLKGIHSVETSIVACGYGSRKHKPPKKSGTSLVKAPNVLQKKPHG